MCQAAGLRRNIVFEVDEALILHEADQPDALLAGFPDQPLRRGVSANQERDHSTVVAAKPGVDSDSKGLQCLLGNRILDRPDRPDPYDLAFRAGNAQVIRSA